MSFPLSAPFVPFVPRRADRGTARPADGMGDCSPIRSGHGATPWSRTVLLQALMSFVVKRAQAADPNTATYRPWSWKFLTRSSQWTGSRRTSAKDIQ